MVPRVSLDKLFRVFGNERQHVVRYELGAKADNRLGNPTGPWRLDVDTSLIKRLDCSGFTREALYRATDGALTLPDGSANQYGWCQDNRLRKLARYSDVQFAAGDPARLFIAFLLVAPGRPIGHVWLLAGGWTLESHGSKGVDSRRWDNANLVHASACFELATRA